MQRLPLSPTLLALTSTLACSVGVPAFDGSFAGPQPDPQDAPGGGSTSGAPGEEPPDVPGSTSGSPDLGHDLDPAPGAECGNGLVDPGESCDDGNLDDADGCESDCTLPTCHNGIVDPGEWCHTAELIPLPGSPAHVTAGDLDGDGLGTVVAVLPDHNRLITVDLDPGGAPEVREWLAGVAPRQVALGDVDLDGILDAVVRTNAGLERVPGTPGGFGPTEVLYPRPDVDAFALAQIDLDGRLDVVVTRPTWVMVPGESPFIGYGLEVLGGAGDGTVEVLSMQLTGGPVNRVSVGGLTPDGLPDLVLAGQNPSGVRVMAGSKAGHVDPVSETITGTVVGMALLHADDDGHLDVVLATEGSAKIMIRPGDGTGALGIPTFVNVAAPATALAAADMNADGLADLLVATDAGELEILEAHGHAQYTTEVTVALGDTADALAASDLDGDGRLDAVASGPEMTGVQLVLARP